VSPDGARLFVFVEHTRDSFKP